VRATKHSDPLYIDAALALYRKHDGSITTDTERFTRDTLKVLERHAVDGRDKDLEPMLLNRLRSSHHALGYNALLRGESRRAIYWFGRGFIRYGGRANAYGVLKALLPWRRLRDTLRKAPVRR
jgi:hypothetical protein